MEAHVQIRGANYLANVHRDLKVLHVKKKVSIVPEPFGLPAFFCPGVQFVSLSGSLNAGLHRSGYKKILSYAM